VIHQNICGFKLPAMLLSKYPEQLDRCGAGGKALRQSAASSRLKQQKHKVWTGVTRPVCLQPKHERRATLYFSPFQFNSVYFVKFNITNSKYSQRALQSVHVRHPCPSISHRIRKNSPKKYNKPFHRECSCSLMRQKF